MRIAGLAVVVLALGSCTSTDRDVSWQEIALPAPNAAVRDVAFCDGQWYVVGGLPTGPAAWRSTDTKTWSPVRLTPVSFYGEQSTLSTVACRGSAVIAVGAASGGAHGNPRTSTWRGEPDGSWREQEPEFTLFGGPESVGVGAAAAGPAGWAIVGNWLGPDGSPGPAVWRSTDGAAFTRGLIPGPGRATDIAPLGAAWLVVGEVYGSSITGAAWTSTGGAAWSQTPIQDPLTLVTPYADGALAIGPAAAWRYDGTAWHRRDSLDATGLRFLSLTAGGALAIVAAGTDQCRLWTTDDGGETWRDLAMPRQLPMTAETVAAAAAHGNTVLLATDDGTTARLHTTTFTAH